MFNPYTTLNLNSYSQDSLIDKLHFLKGGSTMNLHDKIKASRDGSDIVAFIEESQLTIPQLEAKDAEGNTPFFLALHYNLPVLVEYLAKKVNTSTAYNTNNKGDKIITDDACLKSETFSLSLTEVPTKVSQPSMRPISQPVTGDGLTTLSITQKDEGMKTLTENTTGGNSIGDTLSNIVERILSGGKKYHRSSSSVMVGTRALNMTSDTIMSGGESDMSDSSEDKLSKMIKSQKNELLDKLLSIIKNVLSENNVRDSTGTVVESNDRNVKLVKTFLYQKAKNELPGSTAADKFNYLISKSSSELEKMLKDLPDLNKLESDISEHMARKMSETTSVSSDDSLSLTSVKPKKTTKTSSKTTKSKAKTSKKETKAKTSKKTKAKK